MQSLVSVAFMTLLLNPDKRADQRLRLSVRLQQLCHNPWIIWKEVAMNIGGAIP